ncbi:hypothetical protein BN997_01140 [Oceanobacillus oncorhynchi]|uniref:Antitoxin SocA-like Panacea domain-containing protein n=1 Tax=Oceanobacillus oncorhynchi TaxID=545501 RepID=A0A0A1MNX5_9BACI|nr:type II toxin-antitoxin system antitoxin SocA domain-containing protein [Oceanobacillus oncorhynchi]CEI81322.1 hypothetical protein BN997_01140 [Oceanobacillus oncorhynchi]
MKIRKMIFLSEGRNMHRTDINTVANFFLSLGDKTMTHKKLQKLCYYSYSWGKVFFDESIFKNKFQAWVHGPVDPVLYGLYKENRWHPIQQQSAPEINDEELVELLQEVYDSYGHLSGDQLEALTHEELPWKEARAGLQPYEPSRKLIDEVTIMNYYKKMQEELQDD